MADPISDKTRRDDEVIKKITMMLNPAFNKTLIKDEITKAFTFRIKPSQYKKAITILAKKYGLAPNKGIRFIIDEFIKQEERE